MPTVITRVDVHPITRPTGRPITEPTEAQVRAHVVQFKEVLALSGGHHLLPAADEEIWHTTIRLHQQDTR